MSRSRISRARIAERVANASRHLVTRDDEIWHQYRIPPGQKVVHAAVLVPLVEHAGHTAVLLTHRTGHLKNHPGQVSFPGGRVEPTDRHRQETALRETEEEVGIDRSRVEVLGQLPEYEMHSGFRITPVIGWIVPPVEARPDPVEVADVFEVPLEHFLDPGNYRRHEYVLEGEQRRYISVPFAGRYIWGATAGMLYLLHQLLRGH